MSKAVVAIPEHDLSRITITSTSGEISQWLRYHDFEEHVVTAYDKYNGMAMFGLVENVTLEILQQDTIWNTDAWNIDHGKREAQRLYSMLKMLKSIEVDKVPTTATTKRVSISNIKSSHFHSLKQVVAVESHEQARFSDKYSILGNSQECGETWIEALSREAESLELNKPIIYGPPELNFFVLAGVLFVDSKHTILRYLRAFMALAQCFYGYVIAVQLYLYLDADIFTCVGWCMSWNFYVGCWFIVYSTTLVVDHRTGKPGVALRVFRLMDEEDNRACAFKYRFTSGSFAATILTYCVNLTLWVYLFLRWQDQVLWGQTFTIIAVVALMFAPSLSPVGVGLLYYESMAAATRLIRRHKCFVYRENTGCLDWCAVQKNFDILEKFVEDLSEGWKYFVFGTNFVASLSLMSMLVGLVYDSIEWAHAGFQPRSIVVLILFEVIFIITYLYLTIWGWMVAAEVTSACQDVSRQSQQVLAYLRMHNLFEYNTEEYSKAEKFAAYVEKVDLGVKMHGVCISYQLGMRILYPLVSLIAVVLPIILPTVTKNVQIGN